MATQRKPRSPKKKTKQVKTKQVKTKATVEKESKPEKKGSVARVWEIAESMKDASPQEVYEVCEGEGIHPSTTRVQYGYWHKKTFGCTPSERVGRKRRTVVPGGTTTFIDDSEVPVITSTPYAKCAVENGQLNYTDGWHLETVEVYGYVEHVLVSPDDTRYVEARGNEKADLIVDFTESKTPALGRVRYRLYETSRIARINHKEKKAAKKRAEAKQAKKKQAMPRKKKSTKPKPSN